MKVYLAIKLLWEFEIHVNSFNKRKFNCSTLDSRLDYAVEFRIWDFVFIDFKFKRFKELLLPVLTSIRLRVCEFVTQLLVKSQRWIDWLIDRIFFSQMNIFLYILFKFIIKDWQLWKPHLMEITLLCLTWVFEL